MKACGLVFVALSTVAADVVAQSGNLNLAEALKADKLKAVNRYVTQLGGSSSAVHVDAANGPGVVWIEGTNFSEGTIEVNVRGRDLFQQSFVGVAFHKENDSTYEGVYLRPFNFRAADPERHKHAVQYISVPDHDWPQLRQESPDKFEGSVDSSVSPVEWVQLRVLVKQKTLEIYVGTRATPVLQVPKLGQENQGMIGLWVGNGSEGDFSNLKLSKEM